jgi:uncharacterized protein (TIGR03435 family)
MKKIAPLIAMAALALAQSQEKKAAFEVAAIHASKDDGDHDSSSDQGLFRTHNLTLKRLMAMAYEVDVRQIMGGPSWVDSDSYDITARIRAEFAQREKLPELIQSLLADRFQLAIHREPRQIPGYELVVAKKGPKMERAKPDQVGSNIRSRNTHLTAENVTMEAFARSLSRNRDIGELVVDKTGLTGGFMFELDWTPERADPPSDDRPSIFTALQQQLGLKLDTAKVPIMAVVIDRAEKPQIEGMAR